MAQNPFRKCLQKKCGKMQKQPENDRKRSKMAQNPFRKWLQKKCGKMQKHPKK